MSKILNGGKDMNKKGLIEELSRKTKLTIRGSKLVVND